MSESGFFDPELARRIAAEERDGGDASSSQFEGLEHCDPNNPFFSDALVPPKFNVEGELDPKVFDRLNAEVSLPHRKDRIGVRWFNLASAYGGMAVRADSGIGVGYHGDLHLFEPEFVKNKFADGYRWTIVANRRGSVASKFVTLAHELAHIYCGHLGGAFDGYSWLDRRNVPVDMAEFEAAFISHQVAKLAGLTSAADEEARAAYFRARSQGQRHDELQTVTCRLAFRRIAVEAGLTTHGQS